jgi:Raf kinase inhibitor-like YbhB/YbcL family protein
MPSIRHAVIAFSTGCLLAISADPSTAGDFTLTSPDVKDGGTLGEQQVSNIFGCTGGNHSPALEWSGAPTDTKSFVVSLYDMDAPTGSGFWHWVMFNIPADVRKLDGGISADKGAPKGAIQSRADAGVPAYLGACPPSGQKHRYIFTVTALKIDKLPLDSSASGALIGFMSNANALAKATITTTYGR